MERVNEKLSIAISSIHEAKVMVSNAKYAFENSGDVDEVYSLYPELKLEDISEMESMVKTLEDMSSMLEGLKIS